MTDCDNIKARINAPLKTWIIQFIYREGNGWAFVNAFTVSQAETIFKSQTKYEGARVTNIKETKYYGDNIQLVFEGAVTTIGGSTNIQNVIALIDNALSQYDFTSTINAAVEDKIASLNLDDLIHIDFDQYCTNEEVQSMVDSALSRIVIPDVSQYVTVSQLRDAINSIHVHDGVDGADGADGQDGIGIASITYANGVLTITTTDNVPHSFNISTGGGGESTIIEVTSIGRGPMTGTNSAKARADTQADVAFQWIQDQVVDNVRVMKLWWHIGNGVFIDALGYELDTNTL